MVVSKMIRNYLVCKNYKISDHSKWYCDRRSEAGLEHSYQQMQELMLKSAHKHLQGLDQVVVHTGECETIREVFRVHFWEIYELWKTGANILYVDLDVLFVKPVNYFDQFEHFMMFNHTQPRKCTDPHYGVNFDHYFNCGVRYYPHAMSQEVWDLGKKMVDNWNHGRWDAEQIIYNAMLWHQNINIKQALRPELNYQMLQDPRVASQVQASSRINSGMAYTDACVLHFHSSRSALKKFQIMQYVLDHIVDV